MTVTSGLELGKMKRTVYLIVLVSLAASCGKARDPVQGEPKPSKVAEVDITGAVSPSGRFLTYTDWSTGDLALRDLETGEDRPLTDKGSWLESDEFALSSTISPDSRKVAYAWFSADGFYDLRLIGVDGSEPRVLYRDKHFYPWPRNWSPEGKHILTTLQDHDGNSRIVQISVADGSIRELKTLESRPPLQVGFSPDASYIAYDLFPSKDARQRDIYLLSVDGKREVHLIQHPANDLLLGWAPDGERILFASDRAGTLDVWAIGVDDGKPQSAPELVMSQIGPNIVALGFDRNGRYYFGTTEQGTDLYTSTLDPRRNALLGPPKKIGAVGIETFAGWSPDGKFLASISHPGVALWDLYSWVLVIRSMEAGEERRLPLKMTKFHAFQLQWSPDGDSLLAQGRDHAGRAGFYQLSARTGEIAPLVQPEGACPPECLEWPTWAPDGRVLFARRIISGHAIVVRNPGSMKETEVYRVPAPISVGHLAVSPDGQRLVFIWRDLKKRTTAIKIMPAVGGEPRELMRLEQPESISALTWTRDGRELLFGKTSSSDEEPRVELWRIPSGGGEPERLGLLAEGLQVYSLSIHPDGRHIAFTAGTPARREVWVMENVTRPYRPGR